VDFVVCEKPSHFDKETGIFEPIFPIITLIIGVATHFLGKTTNSIRTRNLQDKRTEDTIINRFGLVSGTQGLFADGYWWIPVVAPLIGGVIAIYLYDWFVTAYLPKK
jgi:glycerol uptake facilitator-like aquaporin